jgi:hypothetical protein
MARSGAHREGSLTPIGPGRHLQPMCLGRRAGHRAGRGRGRDVKSEGASSTEQAPPSDRTARSSAASSPRPLRSGVHRCRASRCRPGRAFSTSCTSRRGSQRSPPARDADAGLEAQFRSWRVTGSQSGLGWHCLELLRASVDIDAITPADLASFGDRFVVKPHTGAFSRGVHLLVRRRADRFVDLIDGAERSWAELVASFEDLVSAGRVSRRVAIEELLNPTPSIRDVISVPDDWKIYCCYDRPVVVMQRRLFESADASRWRFRYWSPEWVDLGVAMDPHRHGPHLEPPIDGRALIDAAAAIGEAAKAPFCRIDLYETDRGSGVRRTDPSSRGSAAVA